MLIRSQLLSPGLKRGASSLLHFEREPTEPLISTLQEFREAIEEHKEEGKWITPREKSGLLDAREGFKPLPNGQAALAEVTVRRNGIQILNDPLPALAAALGTICCPVRSK